MVPVVQLVRASDCGSECRGFESHRAPQKKRGHSASFSFGVPGGLGTFFYFANAKALHFIPLGGPPGPLSLAYSLRPNTLYLRKIVQLGSGPNCIILHKSIRYLCVTD